MLIFYTALIDDPDDKEKFKEIYNKYRKMMFYVAMGVLHNKSLAEEAVQDSFIKIAKNISKISTLFVVKRQILLLLLSETLLSII